MSLLSFDLVKVKNQISTKVKYQIKYLKMSEEKQLALILREVCDFESIQDLRDMLVHNLNLSDQPLDSVFVKEVVKRAFTEDRKEAVDLLVDFINSGAGRDPEKRLIVAIIRDHVKLAEIALKNGANIKSSVWQDFLPYIYEWLFRRSNFDTRRKMLVLLVQYGLDTSYHTEDGSNLLHMLYRCVRSNDDDALEIVKLLTNARISVNEANHLGVLPLNHFIFIEHIPIVRFLIEQGTDVNHKDRNKNTLLSYAVSAGNVEIADLLLSRGADVNAKNFAGRTALYKACCCHDDRMIGFLLKRGADIRVKSINGETPFTTLIKSKAYSQQRSNYMRSYQLIVKELSRLRDEDFPLDDDMKLMKKVPIAENFFRKCMSELGEMKRIKFFGPHTYHSVLKVLKDSKKLAKLTKNEKFLQDFESNLVKFPCYGQDLREILKEAVQLRKNMEMVHSRLHYVFNDLLPDVVIRNIAENLTVEDLPLN